GLRERGAVHDVPAAFELEDARQRLTLEADESVRIVLEDGQRAVARKFGDTPAALQRERRPGRALEGRDRVEQRRGSAAGELVDLEPVLVARDLDQLATLFAQDLARPVVGRPLDDHGPGL